MKSNPDGIVGITDGLDSRCGNGLSMRFIQHLDPLNEIRFIREMRVFIVFGPRRSNAESCAHLKPAQMIT